MSSPDQNGLDQTTTLHQLRETIREFVEDAIGVNFIHPRT